jgi:hypothetical protein
MKNRVLILNEESRLDIKRVRNYAEGHRISIRDLQLITAGARKPAGDDPGNCCVIPVGYRCVFSIDQSNDGHTYRHLSISVLGSGAAPNEYAVAEIMKEFGFKSEFPKGKAAPGFAVKLEKIADEKAAVNLIERL